MFLLLYKYSTLYSIHKRMYANVVVRPGPSQQHKSPFPRIIVNPFTSNGVQSASSLGKSIGLSKKIHVSFQNSDHFCYTVCYKFHFILITILRTRFLRFSFKSENSLPILRGIVPGPKTNRNIILNTFNSARLLKQRPFWGFTFYYLMLKRVSLSTY